MVYPNTINNILFVFKTPSLKEEIKCRLKARNLCYYLVRTLLSSRLLSKNLKIKIYKTIILLLIETKPIVSLPSDLIIILSVVLYGCEAWSLTLWKERSLIGSLASKLGR